MCRTIMLSDGDNEVICMTDAPGDILMRAIEIVKKIPDYNFDMLVELLSYRGYRLWKIEIETYEW